MESGQSIRGGGAESTTGLVHRASVPRQPIWPTIDGPLGLSDEESLSYARRFFNFGFLFLPWLWAVNCFYFWPVLRHSPAFPRIRHCESLNFFISFDFHQLEVKEIILSANSGQIGVLPNHAPIATAFDIDILRIRLRKDQWSTIALMGGFAKVGNNEITIVNTVLKDIIDSSPPVPVSAIGFTVFTVLLGAWALTFAIGGERLFGPVWEQLVMYNVAEKYGLTSWY
ncbi:hypothetical protein Sjap_018463 [Stephania japonica]|uniref:ATP synthase F1 complex delta/epsilon subunit N-terminal domain-containing protein n=1 Tax=Stephania japonica TaxID=461633 RepID=A0AAP0I888_9MAGN